MHIIPSLTITEENKILPLEEYPSEDMIDRKMKNVHLQPGVKLKDKHSGILKKDSSSSEVMLKSIPVNSGGIKGGN